MGGSKDIKGNRGIRHIGSGGHLTDRKPRNAVHQDMVFVTPVEFIVLFVCLVGSRMDSQSAILVRLRLVALFKFTRQKRFGVILRSVSSNGGGVKADKGGIDDAAGGKMEYLGFHNVGKYVVVKVLQETVKCPIGRQGFGNIKAAIMGNEKVIIEVVHKVSNHGKAFTFHDNKGTNHGVVGKTFPTGLRKFRDERQIKVEEKRIIKLCNRL